MRSSISAALVLAALPHVLASPTNATGLSTREVFHTCGTTSNAVASDCDKLLDSNFSLDYEGHKCTYWSFIVANKAYNPVCLGKPGNCCIYTKYNLFTVEDVRKYGKILMARCRSVEKNRINGYLITPKGHLCISDGRGCGDCFSN